MLVRAKPIQAVRLQAVLYTHGLLLTMLAVIRVIRPVLPHGLIHVHRAVAPIPSRTPFNQLKLSLIHI